MRSDTTLLSSNDSASAAVDTDSTRLLWAGVSVNWRASNGISGCTQYSKAKVENPPNTIARLMRLKAGLPAAMAAGAIRTDMRAWTK